MDKLLIKQDVMKQLKISISCLNNYIKQNRIGFYKIGGAVKFSQKHVDEFLAANEKPVKEQVKL